jgi:hypothetical protein
VGINAWVIHSDESIWGKDVNEFRPERWLVDKERLAFLDQHFLAVSKSLFSHGIRWKCFADAIYSLVLVQELASARTSRSSK